MQRNKDNNYRRFPSETLQARKQWIDIFKILKKQTRNPKICQPKILHPANYIFSLGHDVSTPSWIDFETFPKKKKNLP